MASESEATQPRSWWQHATRRPAWLLLALTLLFVFVVRVRLLQMPLERDEGEYAYAGQLILQGVPPYQAAYNMKLPGTYAAYALIMALFGQSPAGIHFGLVLVNLACIVLVFLLGRKLLDDAAGAAAALCFALMSLSPSVYGLAGHATHFVLLPALAGTLLLVQALGTTHHGPGETPGTLREARSTGRRLASQLSTLNSQLLCSGLLFGLAFLMKQHGIFFGLFGLLYLLWVRFDQYRTAQAAKLPSLRSRAGRPARPSTLNPSPRQSTAAAGQPSPARRLSHFAAAKRRAEGGGTTDNTDDTDDQKSSSVSANLCNSPPLRVEPAAPQPELNAETPSSIEQRRANLQPFTAPEQRGGGSTLNPSPRQSTAAAGQQLPLRPSHLALFAAGLVLPYGLTCLVLWAAGVFPQFVFWTITYAREYASGNSLVKGPELLKSALQTAVGPNLVFWLLPWAGALVMWWEQRWGSPKEEGRRKKPEDGTPRAEPRLHHSSFLIPNSLSSPRFFLTALFFCSFASTSVGLYFRSHYFILLLPALALLTGVAVSRALYLLRHDRTIELFLAVPVLILFVLGLGAALVGDGAVWFAPSAAAAHRKVYYSTLFTEAAKMAQFIKANSARDARVAVLGSEPEVYFLSGRRSATGYIYTYPLMEAQPYAVRMQAQMIQEIERGRPEYIVYVADDYSWARFAKSPPGLDQWWKDYWQSHFDLVTTANIDEDTEQAPDPSSGLPAGPAPVTLPGTPDLLPADLAAQATGPSATKRLILLKRRF